jgi:hypothetical protein
MLQQPLQPGVARVSVRKTFFVSERRPGGVLSLVEYSDGTAALLLDGRPRGRWPLAEMERAVDAYLQLNAELKREGDECAADRQEALPVTFGGTVHPDAA